MQTPFANGSISFSLCKCPNNFDWDCSKLSVKKLRFRLLQKRRKVRVFVRKGIWKNIISYYSSAFTINSQPRRRGVRSHSVLIFLRSEYDSWWKLCLAISKYKRSCRLRLNFWINRGVTEANVLNAYLSCKFPNLDSSQEYSSGSLIRDDERVYEETILCKTSLCIKVNWIFLQKWNNGTCTKLTWASIKTFTKWKMNLVWGIFPLI